MPCSTKCYKYQRTQQGNLLKAVGSNNMEKFQMSPHDRCREIWNSPHMACVWWRKRRHIWKNCAFFCHNLRAFMWRNIEPKSTFLEKKWQISGLAHCALSASSCISNFMIRQFLSLGTPPHYTTWFTTIGRLLAPAQLLSSQLPLSELYLPDSRFASRPLGLGSLYFSLLGEESWPKSLFIHCVSIFRYGLWLGKKTLGENKLSKNLSSKNIFG